MSNEAEPMPPKWTSDMTGQIYPVGVIPENQVIGAYGKTVKNLEFIKANLVKVNLDRLSQYEQ